MGKLVKAIITIRADIYVDENDELEWIENVLDVEELDILEEILDEPEYTY